MVLYFMGRIYLGGYSLDVTWVTYLVGVYTGGVLIGFYGTSILLRCIEGLTHTL